MIGGFFDLRRCALALLVFAALLACKKKSRTGEAPTASAPATSATAPSPAGTGRYIATIELERVCKGEPLKEAKAYDRAAGRIHPTIVFATGRSGASFTHDSDKRFDAWKTDDNKGYELVLCVTTKSTTKAKDCKGESSTTGAATSLDLEDASYDMVVYEAATAKQVAKKSIDLKIDRKCPAAWFSGKYSSNSRQPDFVPALMNWAKQYVAPAR